MKIAFNVVLSLYGCEEDNRYNNIVSSLKWDKHGSFCEYAWDELVEKMEPEYMYATMCSVVSEILVDQCPSKGFRKLGIMK